MAEEEIYQVDINGAVYGLEDEKARKDNVYSTTETDTGKKWINGKTIYRKVFEIPQFTGHGGSGGITLSIPDRDTIVKIEAIQKITNNRYVPLTVPIITLGTVMFWYVTNGIRFDTMSDDVVCYGISGIVEYTKN